MNISICYLTTLLLLITKCICITPVFNRLAHFRTDNVNLINFQANNNYSITRAYNSLITSPIQYSSVGLVGIQSQISSNIIILTNILSTSLTQININVAVNSLSQMRKLSLNFIVTSASMNNQVDTLFDSVSIVLNQSKIQSISRILTTKYTFGKLYTFPYFSSINLSTQNGSLSEFKLYSKHIQLTRNIQVSIFKGENNILNMVNYSVMIYNSEGDNWQLVYKIVGYVGVKEMSNTTIGSYINSPILQKYFSHPDKLFFAISGFVFNSLIQKNIFINTTSYTNFGSNYISTIGTIQVTIWYIGLVWRSDCPANQSYELQSNDCIPASACNPPFYSTLFFNALACIPCHYTCLTCSGGLPSNCTACDTTKLRYLSGSSCLCIPGYVHKGEVLCYPCQSIITGCNLCTLVNYTISCTNCGLLVPVYEGTFIKGCNCNSSKQQFRNNDLLCINSSGCVKYSIVNNTNNTIAICTACNTSLNFKFTPNNITKQCQCTTGSYINGTLSLGLCLPICGDGIVLAGQECDDGNLVDGDGCSNKCLIEYKWQCSNSPSKCIKIDYFIQVMYVLRITNANKMRVAIEVTPNNLHFTTSSIKSYISHNIPASDYDVNYQDGYLLLDFYYYQSMEGNTYSFTLTPIPSYPNVTINTSIFASGMNAMLTYDTAYSHTSILSLLIIILDCLGLLVLVWSIFSQRFIGIEMIHTIQSAFFLMFLMPICPSPLSSLQMLTYSNGYNYHSINQYTRLYRQPFNIYIIGIEKQFILSFNVMFGVLVLIALVTLIFRIALYIQTIRMVSIESSKKFKKNDQKAKQLHTKIADSCAKTKNLLIFILTKVFTVIVLMCTFSIIFALSSQMTVPSLPYQNVFSQFISMLAAVISFWMIVVLVCLLVIDYGYPQLGLYSFNGLHSIYPVCYTIYSLTFICLIAFGCNRYMILVMALSQIAVVMYLRPYLKWVHNICLVYHQLVIIFCLGMYSYATSSPSNEKIILAGCYSIVIMLYVLIIWNIIRIYGWTTKQLSPQQVEDYLKLATNKNKQVDLQELENKAQGRDFQWVFNQYAEDKVEKKPDSIQIQKEDNNINVNEYEDDENNLKQVKEKLRKKLRKSHNKN